MSFMAAIRKEALETWRTYRFLVVAVVLVGFGLMSPLIAKFTPELFKLIPGAAPYVDIIPRPSVKDAIDQYVKNIGQFALVIGILVTMGSVSQEKQKGTAAMMLVKPLPRWAFLLSKFATHLGVFTLSILIAGVGAYYYTLLLFGPLSFTSWLEMNGLLLLYVMVYVALTLFFSTLSRSQALAGGLSLAVLVILSLVGSIPGIGEVLPGQLPAWGTLLMAQTGQAYWTALGVSLGIILASLLAAWLVLERQEL